MKKLPLLLSMLLFAGIGHAQTTPKAAKSAAKSSHGCHAAIRRSGLAN